MMSYCKFRHDSLIFRRGGTKVVPAAAVSHQKPPADIPGFQILKRDSANGNLVTIENQVHKYIFSFFHLYLFLLSVCVFSFVKYKVYNSSSSPHSLDWVYIPNGKCVCIVCLWERGLLQATATTARRKGCGFRVTDLDRTDRMHWAALDVTKEFGRRRSSRRNCCSIESPLIQ